MCGKTQCRLEVTTPHTRSRPIDYAAPSQQRRALAIFESRRIRVVLSFLAAFTLCYVGSYVALSAYGTYEPAVIGINYVQWYNWAPAGFVKDYRRREALFNLYSPLYCIDRECWHRGGYGGRGKYPVHVPKNIDEVVIAWRKARSGD